MTRAQLEHLIRAAATIASDDEIIVIGSQSILGQFPDAILEERLGTMYLEDALDTAVRDRIAADFAVSRVT